MYQVNVGGTTYNFAAMFGTAKGQIIGGQAWFAGGGAGGSSYNAKLNDAGGGLGGGGQGGDGADGIAATANTGGGGGGSGAPRNSPDKASGAGGSGIVMLRYAGDPVAGAGGTRTTVNGQNVHTYTGGTSSFNLTGADMDARLGATLTSPVTGTGDLTFSGPGLLTLAADNTYTGDTNVAGGTLALASGGELLFDLQDSGVSNQILGSGSLVVDGLLRLDDTAVTDTTGVWNLVDVAGLTATTFGSTFDLALVGGPSFTDAGGGIYNFISGTGEWSFDTSTGALTLQAIIPEPASLAVWGLGGLMLLMIRRRKR